MLERLGSADDQEVLEAARSLHDRVAAAGLSWDSLLVAADEADGEPPETLEEPDPVEDEIGADGDPSDETRRLIDLLLAKPDISADFREELEGYKTDMASGEFDDNDHRYIRAVYKRLNA